ncbi:MAG: TetR/AcrR family transcriptional regulator [Alphaproteobacteria bacterium]|nr:TetR/AcrR family transcriptional regulator [Alphaproteobacteria bacterium]
MTTPIADVMDLRLVRGRATKVRVLDASERLFALRGYDGVSIRDIAEEADVTLGVVGFHGGSKEELFKTVLARRVEELSSKRLLALGALVERTHAPTVREIVHCFVHPYVKLASTGDPQWKAYSKLIARLVGDETWFPYVRELYDPAAIRFLDAIRAIRPKVDERNLVAAYVMMVASTVNMVAGRGRIDALARTRRRGGEVIEFCDTIVDFCAAGFDAAIGWPPPRPARARRMPQ